MSVQRLKKNLPWKNEVVRQSFHLGLGFFLSGVLFFTSLNFFRLFLVGLFLVGLVVALAAHFRVFKPLNALLVFVERKHEMIPGQSVFLFLVGVLIPSFFLSSSLAVFLGVFALTLQDGFSTLVGVRFGKTKLFPGKSLEGSLGGLAACVVGLSFFLPFSTALGLSLLATVVELFPVDDSLSIPLAVSLAASFLV